MAWHEKPDVWIRPESNGLLDVSCTGCRRRLPGTWVRATRKMPLIWREAHMPTQENKKIIALHFPSDERVLPGKNAVSARHSHEPHGPRVKKGQMKNLTVFDSRG